jgi:hypothetical protein
MQINIVLINEKKFLSIEGNPQITSNKQSIKILHICGCELNQHFLIGTKDKFPKEQNNRHLNIKFCKNHFQTSLKKINPKK